MKTVVALVVGLIVGGAVNMGLVVVGPLIIPPPEGVDVSDMESLAAGIHRFQLKHFVFPFLAHALGTFFGAFVGHIVARNYRDRIAYAIGLLSFVGGVAAATMIPAPLWFLAVDLILAYIPMAFLAIKLGRAIRDE